MSEWQPIETAPKDGTHIVAYEPCDSERREQTCAIVHWYINKWEHFEAEGDSGLYRKVIDESPGWWEGGPWSPWRATHWMPLPEPPEDESATSKPALDNPGARTEDYTDDKSKT